MKAAYDLMLLAFFAGKVHEREVPIEDLRDGQSGQVVDVVSDAETDRNNADPRQEEDSVKTSSESGDVVESLAPSGGSSQR